MRYGGSHTGVVESQICRCAHTILSDSQVEPMDMVAYDTFRSSRSRIPPTVTWSGEWALGGVIPRCETHGDVPYQLEMMCKFSVRTARIRGRPQRNAVEFSSELMTKGLVTEHG